MSDPADISTRASLQIVHVFPDSARFSCGPCNAIMAFMECQLAQGLEVRAISPIDNAIPAEQRQPIDHLPIQEFDRETTEVSALAEGGGVRPIFHFHGIGPWMDRLAWQLRGKGLPYVFTSHGHLHFHGKIHRLKKWFYLHFVDRFLREASGLHFLTQREKERSRFILPRSPRPVLVQSNVIRLPAEAIVPSPRSTLGVPDGTFIFAYLGRLDVRHKGLDILLKAFAEVCRDSDAHLLMIGPDFAGGRQFLEDLGRNLGQNQRIHFLGSQVGAVKWSLLKMADAFVSPSRWEACSISQAEAIGLGLPTIVSDEINMAPEMVAAGAALASPLSVEALAATMRRVLEDAALRRSLSDAGRKWAVETCSPVRAGERFLEFYREAGEAAVSPNIPVDRLKA